MHAIKGDYIQTLVMQETPQTKTVILFHVRQYPSLIKHQTCFPSSSIRETSMVMSKGNFLFLCVALGVLLVSNGIESLHLKVDRKQC